MKASDLTVDGMGLDALAEVVVDAIAEAIAPLAARIAELESTKGIAPADYQHLAHRLAHLEAQPKMAYAGVWTSGKSYRDGEVVTHQGSAWVCTAPISAGQQFDHSQFKLLVKRGADAKAAK